MVAEESILTKKKEEVDTTIAEKKKTSKGVKFKDDTKVEEDGDNEEEDDNEDDDGLSSKWILQKLKESPPPEALPIGWIMKRSLSQPNCYYYYNQETGTCRWDTPVVLSAEQLGGLVQQMEEAASKNNKEQRSKTTKSASSSASAIAEKAAKQLIQQDTTTKRPSSDTTTSTTASPSSKRVKIDSSSENAAAPSSSTTPSTDHDNLKEVRVLHLLRKHKDSRRPASWRNPHITSTIPEAKQELEEFLEIIAEASTPEELRATFEELARTESDCSSAKRGGDLGFFGRRKMQPAFEKASFGLDIGELSGIVETSSGVHILLRIG